jgi:DNA-binding LacI/PurR family transcriptional regulator
LGFRVEVVSLADFNGDANRLAATLKARGIRGVLLGFSQARDHPELLDPSSFCIAGLSAYFSGIPVDRANFHGFYNVQLALAEMRKLGYRRTALVTPEFNNRVSNNTWSGAFLDYQRGLPEGERCEPFIPAGDDYEREFDRWLRRCKPDSLLVYKSPVREMLARQGKRVPEDLGVAYLYGTSDEMGSAAGIDGNMPAVGAAAFDLVVEKLNSNSLGVPEHPKEVLIKGTWCHGATVASQNVRRSPAATKSRRSSSVK